VVTVVSDDFSILSVDDTLNTTLHEVGPVQYSSCDSNSGKCQAIVYWGIIPATGSDTVYVNEGSSTVALRVQIYELAGVRAIGNTASCTGGNACSSTSFPVDSIILATGRDVSNKGTGFTTYYAYQSSSVSGSEYATESSSGSTSFPFSTSASDVEVGVVFIIGSYGFLSCPSGFYFCYQVAPSTSNPSSATAKSSCDNPYISQSSCPGGILSPPACSGSTTPCFSVQMNYYTTKGYIEQAVIGVDAPNATFPDGSVNIYEALIDPNGTAHFGSDCSGGYEYCQYWVFGYPLAWSPSWYEQAYTIAIFSNATMWFGIENVNYDNSTHYYDGIFSTSTYGSPNDAHFDAGPVGNDQGELATFSSSWAAVGILSAPSFPSASGFEEGVQYYGEYHSVYGPLTGERSNFAN
jgi:hypothetical protein